MPNFISTLRNRNMLHSIMPGTEDLLQASSTTAYIGIDPTAPSLHIGNLATLMLLKHLQQAGHKPIVLLGGATAMIGDPSFKAAERKLLDKATIQHNQTCIEKQIEHLLPEQGKNAVQILNNYDWLHQIDYLSFLRDIGKYITLNYIIAKDAIKTRLKTGISYTEFAYPLLQAYDFYYLYKNHNVKLQMGGSDQWGNITTGTELIRKKMGSQAFGLTTPLITKSDGSKFGKSEQGNIWLDPKRTSPYQFYQFWLNCSDEEAPLLMKKLTLLDLKTLQELTKEHEQAPHKRLLQKELAKIMTTMVHTQKAFEQVKLASEILFERADLAGLENLDESILLEALAEVPQININKEDLAQTATVIDLLCTTTKGKIFSSKRSAREMMQAGGVRINKMRVTNPEQEVGFTWFWDKYFLVQKGKKNYYLIKLI